MRAWSMLGAYAAAAAQLVIVGDDLQGEGKYRAEMETLAGQLGCSARFVGFQKNVVEWLTASDVAVVPSHVEPLGNAALEAMACSLPVIASAVGGLPEMILPERTGLLVPPRSPGSLAAAIARLVADGETRRRFGEQGRQHCEEFFDLKAHVRSVLDQYAQMVPQGRFVLAH